MKKFIIVLMAFSLAVSAFAMRSYWNKLLTTQVHTVGIGADSLVTSATKDVTFPETFDNIPVVLIVPPLGAEGTWTADSITTSGCDVVVDACGNFCSTSIKVVILAHERL